MGDKEPTTAVLDATYETVILAIDLIGDEVDKIPDRIFQAINDLNFQKEVENFLTDYGQKLLQEKSTNRSLTERDARLCGA